MTEGSFDNLAKSIMDEYLSWDPAFATQVGWHKYDHKLKDLSRDASNRQIERFSEFIAVLEKLNPDNLEPDQLLDRDFAVHLLKLKIFELGKIRRDEKASFAATELGNSLFFLIAREHPSPDVRLDSIIGRLEAVPDFLEKPKKSVTTPYRLWNEILSETGERMPRFLEELRELSSSLSKDKGQHKRLDKAVREAVDAIDDYNRWMREDVIPNAVDETSIGPDLYRRYLELLDYGVTPEEALSIAEQYLLDVNRRKAEVARKIVRSGDAVEAIRLMRSDHSKDFEEVLKEYRSSVLKARDFAVKKALVTIPDGEELRIVETPSYMRHIVPYAAQYEAGRFDNDKTGLFLVTQDQGNPETLEENSHVGIVNTAVHEGYPGHHLHGVCANLNPSYLRILHQSPDFGEGWGLYCEEMMISQGYNDTPMGRLTTLNDLGFRLARQIADVKLATGRMTLKQAAELMMKETGTNPQAAISEAKAMTLSPTYYSSYFIGKLGVLQMRRDAEKALGNRFNLRFFHDSLIYSGCMTVPFMRRALGLKMKEKYGVDLGTPKESIYEYAMRTLRS